MAHNCNRLRTAHILCAVATLSTAPTLAQAEEPPPTPSAAEFLALPLPPPIEGLIGLPQTYTKARSAYLDLITREAEQKGLPPCAGRCGREGRERVQSLCGRGYRRGRAHAGAPGNGCYAGLSGRSHRSVRP